MAFATHADLAARLGVTFTSDEQSRADTLLTLSSGLIQREARQTIERVDNDVLTTLGTRDERFRLPERPVLSVASVVLDGVTLTAGDGTAGTFYVSGDRLIRLQGWGTFVPVNNWGWGAPSQTLVVTYTHGYTEIPDAIRAVCLEAVVRVWVNPGNTMHEYMGSERIVYAQQATPTGLMLNAEEQRVIHDVLRRTSGNVALR